MIGRQMKYRAVLVLCAVGIIAGALVCEAAKVGGGRRRLTSTPSESQISLSQVRVLEGRPAPFVLDARSAVLVPYNSSVYLYAYNEHLRMQPASLAKLMTFYIALKSLREGRITLDTPVTISETAWRLSINRSVSKMFLEVGQRVPLRDLLYGLMVSSGNDAAWAIAEYIGGSAQAFVAMMNEESRKLGLDETHFENPDGLPAPNQYTTAADMAKLGSIIVRQFPEALTYTSTKEFTFHAITQRNWNTLLFYDSRVDGLKTGHVEEAGYHLVASAHEGDLYLIAVVMGAPNAEKRRLETEKLLDWGFRTFAAVNPDWTRVVDDKVTVYEGKYSSVPIVPALKPFAVVYREEVKTVKLLGQLDVPYLIAPVEKGVKVGTLTFMRGDQVLNEIPLVTQRAVPQAGFLGRMLDRIKLVFVSAFYGIGALIHRLIRTALSAL